jgi:hypothetical protein
MRTLARYNRDNGTPASLSAAYTRIGVPIRSPPLADAGHASRPVPVRLCP